MISNGVDIVLISKLNKLINDKFMSKVFTDIEEAYIKKSNYSLNTIAGILAAKEAVLKALKKGINDYALKDIEIVHDEDNAPSINFLNELKTLKYKSISISISHDGDYTIASVIILY